MQEKVCNYLLIICLIIFIDISGELHEKWRYDHLSGSLIQATLTTFIFGSYSYEYLRRDTPDYFVCAFNDSSVWVKLQIRV